MHLAPVSLLEKERKMILEKSKLTRTLIVSPGSKYVETKKIPLDKIYVPQNVKGTTVNRARYKGLNSNHINKLAESFAKGIDYSKPLPIVVKKPQWVDGVYYEYELIAGAHRFEAKRKNKFTEWLFDVYETGVDGVSNAKAVASLQIRENDHTPEQPNSAEDLINLLSYLINVKELENTEDAIKDYLYENTNHLHSSTLAKVIRQTVTRNGAYQDIKTYPAEQLVSMLQGNPEKRDYAWGGSYDHNRDMFGWTVLEGYEYEYITNALKKLDETGKGSYFLCHTKAPTEKKDLKTRRISQINAIGQLERGIEKAYKFKQETGKWPWHIESFLGQDVKNKEKQFLTQKEVA